MFASIKQVVFPVAARVADALSNSLHSDKFRDLFDFKTTCALIGTPSYFASITIADVTPLLSFAVGLTTLVLGLLKIIELVTGVKISDLLRRRHEDEATKDE